MPIKNESIDFSDISGGKNSAFPRHAIAPNQVVDTLNALHEAIGLSRAPGYLGIKTTALFSTPIRGLFVYTLDNGTEKLIAVSDSKVWNIAVTGTKTEIGTLTADTECYAVNAAGKLWIVNGTDFVKVENDLSVYRVQIATPTGTSASHIAGGSLPVGIYTCYVAYARKNADGQYLYSLPYSLGPVTLSGGDLSIRIIAPNSTDPQVTHKVAFITDAGGAVPYYYGEVTNATANLDITSTASRNSFILMSTVSASNQILPITPSAIATFDDKLLVWDINDRTLYWSLKTDINPLDMERFLAQNFRTMSYTINSVFSIDVDLYLNHLGNGVSKIISGDMSSIIKRTQKALWYLDCRTPEGKSNVCFHKGVAFGLTNDGFRFFDGETFSEDMSFHIKPDIDSAYDTLAAFMPSAVVFRRSGKRTEYRFSFNNSIYSTLSNNDQLVFNLDFYFDPMASKKTWERWENGFHGMVQFEKQWYGAQSFAASGQIVSESGSVDIYCHERDGMFASVAFIKQLYVLYRTFIDDLDGITIWGAPYTLAQSGGIIEGQLIIFDAGNSKYSFEIRGSASTLAVLPSESSGDGLVLPFTMSPQYPIGTANPISFECRGNSVAVEISQLADDVEFFLYKLQLPRAKQIKHNLT